VQLAGSRSNVVSAIVAGKIKQLRLAELRSHSTFDLPDPIHRNQFGRSLRNQSLADEYHSDTGGQARLHRGFSLSDYKQQSFLSRQKFGTNAWKLIAIFGANKSDEFLLGIFPPDHGGNHAPPPAPQPTLPAK
jgi:hypothetical protein